MTEKLPTAEEALLEIRSLLRNRLLQVRHHEPTFRHGAIIADGYSAAEVPEWELRRMLDTISSALDKGEEDDTSRADEPAQ